MNLVAQAPNSVEDLDRAIGEFQRQAEVTRNLLSAERELKGKLTRNIKFNRIRPTLRFIYGQTPPGNIPQRRRDSLVALDDSSRALCAIAFTPQAILQLTDDAFEALISGVPEFIEKKHLAGLIESKIGYFIRRTLKDLVEDKPMPLLWIDSRPSKRRKIGDVRRNTEIEVGGAIRHLHQQDSLVLPQGQSFRQTAGSVLDDDVATDPWEDSQPSSRALHPQDQPQPDSSNSTRDRMFIQSPKNTDSANGSVADHELFPDLSGSVDLLYNDLRAGWFGRGIGLSDTDMLHQFEVWAHMHENASAIGDEHELSWSDQLS